ncbi:multiubiquitin domain-containing protein [Deinococcus peraridilitoris]|uniref:Multi-ubiquitin domain-containing protein n=1 Tax=Deinococcus peraridilitoris (strain DSM 19664 / LMG 22246 / CIP 109416 / KR-200) TaxID=937777 RepID=L0A1Z4_DEIPD|nr:multiubiquitin domain-containing protein [Deinococcus peraridilitoris]AFZ67177.1 hypothetical protein Deipe_1644 [Deinococcus peraridilitoris DSM 19664]
MTTPSTQHNDDHGRDKVTTIIVNGREKQVTDKEMTYDQVVHLAYDNPPSGPNVLITVTFRRGHGDKPEGSLTAGSSVRLKEGMIFNVVLTDKS